MSQYNQIYNGNFEEATTQYECLMCQKNITTLIFRHLRTGNCKYANSVETQQCGACKA